MLQVKNGVTIAKFSYPMRGQPVLAVIDNYDAFLEVEKERKNI